MWNITKTTNFSSLNDVYEFYKNKVIKIVNIKQILFYADKCNVQPDWIGSSQYNGNLIAYYGEKRTKECWERWRSSL